MNTSYKGKAVSLLLSEVFPPRIGGSGQWLHDIYSRLPTEHTVFLVGKTDGDEEYDRESDLRIVRTDMHSSLWTFLSISGLMYFWRLIGNAYKLHKMHGFSEIHCGRVLPEGLIGLICSWLTGSRLVCYIHGEDIEISRDSKEHRLMTQFVLSRADRLICNCSHTKKLLVDSWRCNLENVHVLHPRTDTTLFKPLPTRDEARKKLGWQGRKVILTVSRLNERKGHDRLLRALPQIIEKSPETLYVIVGEGVHAKFGKSLIKIVDDLNLHDHVKFTGACDLDALIQYYQCCDLFVLPNYQIGGNLEGFGIVLLEAQACGVPVIAGDSGGTVETMSVGRSGFVVDCTDPQNLVEPVSRLLLDDELRHNMGRHGQQRILDNFSWNNFDDAVAETVQFQDECSPVFQPK